VAIPDRTEIGARLARLRASRAEYAGDVHALSEALERYAQGHLLAEDSEVGRLRRQLARVERERDELARQLRQAREGQARLAGHLRQLSDAIGGPSIALPEPDREVPLLRHDAPEVAADGG
jgi:chromosome segregation ATPase